jgi:two-component system, OmpR family, phosphate regulon sensor histidine kinase PhoR
MNPRSPRSISFMIASSIAVIVYCSLYLIFFKSKEISSPWLVIVIMSLAAGSVTFFLIMKFIEKFLHQKIKIIYKNIHTFKSQAEKKPNIIMSEDVLHDIELEVSHWVEEKIKEVKELKETDHYRKEYIGNLAHELKTPLFGIQGYIETLLDDELEDKERIHLFLTKANRQADRLGELISDLDLITKLESAAVPMNMERFDLVALAQKVIEGLENFAKLKRIHLHFKDGSPKHVWVNGDVSRIEQVITNLVSNAIHYGQEQGEVKFRFYDMDEHVLFEIADDGIGIPKEDLPRIFERFYRVDKSRSRNDGGSGLGLAICKHIMEAHQETLTVRSTEGIGSTFAFTMRKA